MEPATPPDPGIRKTVDRGVAWVGLASVFVALFDVGGLIVILRYWVSKSEFGVASTVVTLFNALELVGEMGLVAAVVQRGETARDRLSTMFWLGMAFAVALYGVIFFAAPGFAAFHHTPQITSLLRVGALTLLIRSAFTIHLALLKQQLRFRELSIVRIVTNAIELVVKVGLAAAGAGAWCFVFAVLARNTVYAIGLTAVVRFRPALVCRPREITGDIKFGLRATSSEILYQVYSNLHYQIVNAYFGNAALGVYRAAYELVVEPVRFVSQVITVVAFPTFARLRFDARAVIDQFVAFTRQNLVVVLTLVALVLVAADDALVVLLGPSYAPAATAARVLAVIGILRSLSHLGPPLLDGLGRPDLTLRYQLTATVMLGVCFVSFAALLPDLGFLSVAIAWAVGYPVAFSLLTYMMFSRIGLSLRGYLARVWRIPALVAIAGAAGAGVQALAAGLSTGARFGLTAGVTVGTSLALLGIVEGFTPRAIVRALRA